jgi:glycosyltransferase involved in cell wall biosynthesis
VLSSLGDETALANDLENLLAHPEYASKLGQNAYLKIREKFTAEKSARSIESFYHEIL